MNSAVQTALDSWTPPFATIATLLVTAAIYARGFHRLHRQMPQRFPTWRLATFMGGMAALFTNAGFGKDFWATIAPHGVIELTAIQIAGAAGLLIAAGALFPGRRRRRDALVANARRAGTLILGVASMLVVAGTIEAFVSPRRLPVSVRIAIGLFTALVLVLYFAGAGRRDAAVTTDRAA